MKKSILFSEIFKTLTLLCRKQKGLKNMAKVKIKNALPAKLKASNDISINEYSQTLAELKKQIQTAQLKSVSSANKELIHLYWKVGKIIAERQEKSGWGTKVIEKLAKDLQNEFPGIEGFSRTNIFRMRAFYQTYKIVPLPVGQLGELEHLGVLAQIPWSHNIILIEKLDHIKERIWYANKTLEHGWSRDMLAEWIDSKLHKREGRALTNFKATLPKPQSDLAQQALKDPYLFDFLTLHKDFLEKTWKMV